MEKWEMPFFFFFLMLGMELRTLWLCSKHFAKLFPWHLDSYTKGHSQQMELDINKK